MDWLLQHATEPGLRQSTITWVDALQKAIRAAAIRSVDRSEVIAKILDFWPSLGTDESPIRQLEVMEMVNPASIRVILDRGPADPRNAHEVMTGAMLDRSYPEFEAALHSKHADPTYEHSTTLTNACDLGEDTVWRTMRVPATEAYNPFVDALLADGRVRPDDPECRALYVCATYGSNILIRLLLAYSHPPTPAMIRKAISAARKYPETQRLLRAALPADE
jgi:hypothetical protein